MRVEVVKDFHPIHFPASFFLASNRVQRAKSPPLAFLMTVKKEEPSFPFPLARPTRAAGSVTPFASPTYVTATKKSSPPPCAERRFVLY